MLNSIEKKTQKYLYISLTAILLSFILLPKLVPIRSLYYLIIAVPCLIIFPIHFARVKVVLQNLWPVVAIGAFFALSDIWGGGPGFEAGAKAFRHLFALLVFIMAIMLVEKPYDLFNKLLPLLVAAASINVILSSILFYADNPFSMRLHGFSEFRYSTILAALYGWSFLISAYLFLNVTSHSKKALYAFQCILLLGGILLTETKTPVIALSIAAIYYAFSLGKKRLAASAIVCLAIASVIPFLWKDVEAVRFITIIYRFELWKLLLSQLDSHWLLGWGKGAPQGWDIMGHHHDHSHNVYVGTLYFHGIVGLLMILAALFTLYRKAANDSNNILPLTLIAYMLSSFLVDIQELFVPPGILWLLLWFPVSTVLGRRVTHASLAES